VTTAYTNATIIPVEGATVENGTLVVENGLIKELGDDIDTTDMEVVDCENKFIIPGLIDAHSHVGLFEEGRTGGSDGNEATSPITPYLRSMDAIFTEDEGFNDARKGGVTTLGITPGSANLIGGQFCVIKAIPGTQIISDMLIREPAGVKMALGENPRRVYKNKNKAPSTRMANAHLIREAFYKAIDYRTKWREYESKLENEQSKSEEERNVISQPEFDMANEILVKILAGTIPVMNHCHRADDIVTAVRLSEEFGYKLVVHHATESHKIADYLVDRDIPVVVGPLMTSRSKAELRDRTVSTPGIMMDAGALVCITNDAPVIPIWMLRESMILAIREGLDPTRALETITINPAKILGVDNHVGSLLPGKDADFLILNGDPLDASSSVEKTYINGDIVFNRN